MIYTPKHIREKFNIVPKQYADFKSLTGDVADNIKGADKIGPKTAVSLLGEFNTLENILANLERVKKPSIKESLMRNAERLRINYKLIRLENRASLPFALHELEYRYTGLTTNEVLKGIGLR